jgi:hypothetical protein
MTQQPQIAGLRLPSLLAVAVALLAMAAMISSSARGAVVTLAADAVLDGSDYNGEFIEIIDGPSGPTSVRLIAGAEIGGFTVRGSSRLVVDGGISNGSGSLLDDSTLTMLDGVLLPAAASPEAVPIAIVGFDNSRVHIYGGVFYLAEMWDMSEAHIYLKEIDYFLENDYGRQRCYTIAGTTIYGTILNRRPNNPTGAVGLSAFEGATVTVHLVPEPKSFVLLAILGFFLQPRRDGPA